ncbi:MAG: class I SAM-dependent methyltransferase, partial [Azospirillaceae bacterium]
DQDPRDALWRKRAQDYGRMGSPLRPNAQDIGFLEDAVARWSADAGRPPVALLLGVTPAITQMRWPAGSRLRALDKSPDMVRALWSPPAGLDARVETGEWLEMDRHVAAGSIDLAFCDGGFTLFRFPDEQRRLAEGLARVLSPGGLAVLRMFVRATGTDSPDRVLADFEAGAFDSFHAFKWRLVMAMQQDEQAGVDLDDVHRRFAERRSGSAAFRSALARFDAATVDTIDVYRGLHQRHFFPALPSLEAAFAGALTRRSHSFPDYPLGDRSPTIVWSKAD